MGSVQGSDPVGSVQDSTDSQWKPLGRSDLPNGSRDLFYGARRWFVTPEIYVAEHTVLGQRIVCAVNGELSRTHVCIWLHTVLGQRMICAVNGELHRTCMAAYRVRAAHVYACVNGAGRT